MVNDLKADAYHFSPQYDSSQMQRPKPDSRSKRHAPCPAQASPFEAVGQADVHPGPE
eukprot:gene12032-3550_t